MRKKSLISKKIKIAKIDFSFVSEHCATIWNKKMEPVLFEGEGGLYIL